MRILQDQARSHYNSLKALCGLALASSFISSCSFPQQFSMSFHLVTELSGVPGLPMQDLLCLKYSSSFHSPPPHLAAFHLSDGFLNALSREGFPHNCNFCHISYLLYYYTHLGPVRIFFFFFNTGSPYTAQSGLEPVVFQLLLPECWVYRHVPTFPSRTVFLIFLISCKRVNSLRTGIKSITSIVKSYNPG